MPEKNTGQSQEGAPQEGTPQDLTAGDTTPATPVVAPAQASDKTIPGGRYIVDGRAVNANGEPIKE